MPEKQRVRDLSPSSTRSTLRRRQPVCNPNVEHGKMDEVSYILLTTGLPILFLQRFLVSKHEAHTARAHVFNGLGDATAASFAT
jgi:hypothetical protein